MKHVEQKRNIDSKILNEIVKSIKQINYGEVVIIVHDSKIVQIEKKEKKRF
ncbi:MAG: YezD family protein [bacterium]